MQVAITLGIFVGAAFFCGGNASLSLESISEDAATDCTCVVNNVQVCTRNEKLRRDLCSQPVDMNHTVRAGTSQLKWVDLDLGMLPRDAILGGYEGTLNYYILLAAYGGGTHIGKLSEKYDGRGPLEGHICERGREIGVNSYLVLTGPSGSYSWKLSRSNQALPKGTVRAGRDPGSGGAYHVGRGAAAQSVLVPGKLGGTRLYMPYYGEKSTDVYEVLIDNSQL